MNMKYALTKRPDGEWANMTRRIVCLFTFNWGLNNVTLWEMAALI